MRLAPAASTRPARIAATILVAVAALLASLLTSAPGANGRTPTAANPLANHPWGIFTGVADGIYRYYPTATGTRKALLAKIALRPRARWFTSQNTTQEMRGLVSGYVNDVQTAQGQDTIVPMALFRQFPNHESHKSEPIDQQTYKNWYNAAANGIGSAHAMVILEPDLPVILKDAWRPDIREQLVNYAAGKLGALAHTSAYIDAGSADWLPVADAARLLKRSGVAKIRGFALGGTHYDTTVNNIRYGQKIVAKLASMRIHNVHFVIDTADNGHGFTFNQYRARHPGSDVTNPIVCQTKTQRVCETLGIPPTWKVGLAKWHLGRAAGTARRLVDAYVWYNRPWLEHNTDPFSLSRALDLARSTPFAMCTTPCG